jgi:hypothetical protein
MDLHEAQANQRTGVSSLSAAELERRALAWLHTEAGFAQVFTINKAGYPVGRTMVAVVDEAFCVWLVQRKVHKRIGHWKRNPRTEVMWIGSPAPGSRNDFPHVYDFNLLVPRAVFIRGDAQFLDDAALLAAFQRQTAINRAKGWIRAPERTPENVVSELVGVIIRPLQVRLEGFGNGAESFVLRPGMRS